MGLSRQVVRHELHCNLHWMLCPLGVSENLAGHRVDVASFDLRGVAIFGVVHQQLVALAQPGVQVVRVECVAFVEAVRPARGLRHAATLVDVQQGKHHQIFQHGAALRHARGRRQCCSSSAQRLDAARHFAAGRSRRLAAYPLRSHSGGCRRLRWSGQNRRRQQDGTSHGGWATTSNRYWGAWPQQKNPN